MQDTSYITNSLCRILAPHAGRKLVIQLLDGQSHHLPVCALPLNSLTLFEERQGAAVPLYLFKYRPSQPYAPTPPRGRRYYFQHQRLPIGDCKFQRRGASSFLCCYMAADRYQGQQYVCAGELVALQALTNVLNYLKVQKVDINKAYILRFLTVHYAHNQCPADQEIWPRQS
jgi:hypothetical protein